MFSSNIRKSNKYEYYIGIQYANRSTQNSRGKNKKKGETKNMIIKCSELDVISNVAET